MPDYKIKDIQLAEFGHREIEVAENQMRPLLGGRQN